MATYDNPRNGVVHWVDSSWPTRTACNLLAVDSQSPRYDMVGEPRDVTCCKCGETASFLDASQKAFDAAGGIQELLRQSKRRRVSRWRRHYHFLGQQPWRRLSSWALSRGSTRCCEIFRRIRTALRRCGTVPGRAPSAMPRPAIQSTAAPLKRRNRSHES